MSAITIPYSFVTGTTILAAQVNTNFQTIANVVNGNLDNSNLSNTANIALTKLNLTAEALNLQGTGSFTWASGISGDIQPRVAETSDGAIAFGAGTTNLVDTYLYRSAANTLSIANSIGGTAGTLVVGTLTATTISGAISAGAITCTSLNSTGTIVGSTSLTLGAAAGTTGSILLKGSTSGTVTITVANAAGTYGLTLPTALPSLAGAMLVSTTGGVLSFSNTPPRYVSAQTAISTGSQQTFAHGLGVAPKKVWCSLVCQTANGGYAVGNEVFLNATAGFGASAGIAFFADATNVYVTVGNNIAICFLSTFNVADITTADWKLVVYAEP